MCILSSHVSFKWSAVSAHWRDLLRWQVVGGIAGLTSVLNLTALLKYILRHQANAISVELVFVLAQDNRRAFHFPRVTEQPCLAAGLVVAGIALIRLGCGT
jgi:uncharacterized membrane protein YdcZ (DUF606 family)